jgi:hypothetical protein
MHNLYPIRTCFKVIILSLSCLFMKASAVSAQSITSFSPTKATPGTMVMIVGTGLSSVTSVKFCGYPDSALIIASDDTIYARVGTNCEAQAPGYITLVSPGGTATSAGKFTPVPLPPTITRYYPDSCKYGDTVTIIGTNLVNVTGSCSIVGYYAAHIIGVSFDTLKFVVLDGDPTYHDITVTTTGGTASAWGIVYVPLPTITSFSPDIAGPGQPVSITGSNFGGLSRVSFGGVPAQSFQLTSPTTILAYPGSGASGQVAVTARGGSVGKGGFVFIPPAKPTVTSFTPTSAGKDSTVTIKGTNLAAATAVSFGGVPAASYTVVDSTTITAVVGSGASGSVSVTTPGGTASLTGFTYVGSRPVIISFSPTNAIGGDTVTITGANFTGATGVSFGYVPAASFTVTNTNTIKAVVGSGASGAVIVAVNTDTAYAYGFTYSSSPPPAPAITGFTPASATTNASVVITGSGFTGATAVSFGGTPALSFSVVNANTINAVVGAGSSGSVRVIVNRDTAVLGGFSFIPPPPPPAPTITSFSPTKATPGTMVMIVGTGLNSVTSVKFCGYPDSALIIGSDDTIYARVGTNCEAQAPGYITLVSPGGNATSTGKFTPVPLPPTITGYYPDTCKYGDTVTIIGTNLVNVTGSCSIVGYYAGHIIGVSFDTLKFVVLEGDPTYHDITVTTTGGTASAWGIVFVPLPTITAFSPDIAGPGQPVTITGTDFGGLSRVSFGGVPAQSFQLTSPTTIVAYPGSGASGQVVVTARGGSTGKAGFVFIPAAKPTITSFTPTSAGKDSTVTIKGTNLTAATAVSFGGVPAASYTVVDSTTITAVVGSGASGAVSVTTPGGAASLAGFAYSGPTPPPPVHGPVLYSITPAHAAKGATVTIHGAYLDSVNAVSFGGTAAQSFTIGSDSSITAVIGAGSSGNVIVRSQNGTDTLHNSFTFDSTIVTPPGDSTVTPPGDTTVTPPPAVPAPFQLVQFSGTAYGNQPMLSWSVKHDSSIANYGILHGTDTSHLTLLTNILAKWKDTTSYTFTDINPSSGVNYYRLQMTDVRLNVTYSPVIAVQLAGVTPTLTTYPNPVTGSFVTVNLPSVTAPSQFQVVDMWGNVVQLVPVAAGTPQVNIKVMNMNRGLYKIVWSNGNSVSYQTVLILK